MGEAEIEHGHKSWEQSSTWPGFRLGNQTVIFVDICGSPRTIPRTPGEPEDSMHNSLIKAQKESQGIWGRSRLGLGVSCYIKGCNEPASLRLPPSVASLKDMIVQVAADSEELDFW